mmetsp:Transcript_8980/g.14556  ORF Transcript_8980/g.14556 Transcript_8980/m.14556 type:complete len:411 (+) Transcript_8980:311-1543(+)
MEDGNIDGDGTHPSPRHTSELKVRPSSYAISGLRNRRHQAKRSSAGWIFFLLPVSGQRFIMVSSVCFLITLFLCTVTIYLLATANANTIGLIQIAVAIVTCDFFTVCLVWDGVYAEAQSRLNVSGLFALALLLLSIAGMAEATIKWREGGIETSSITEHYVFLGTMLGCALKAIVHLFLVINCIFLPSLAFSDKISGSGGGILPGNGSYYGSGGRGSNWPLLSRNNMAPSKMMMRSQYENFISVLNLDLGLSLATVLLCWDYTFSDLRLETIFDAFSSSFCMLNVLLIFALPIWSVVLWLAVVNELHAASTGIIFSGSIFLGFFCCVKGIGEFFEPAKANWQKAHQNVVLLSCLVVVVARVYLYICFLQIHKFLGKGKKFKQQVNRLRYYSKEQKIIPRPGTKQYGTLCS